MRDIYRLIDAICEAYDNPAWKPKDGKTYCNYVVNFICKQFGYTAFDTKPWPFLANSMVQHMRKNRTEWMAIEPGFAQDFANRGSLVVAGQEREGHGHVCVIRPGYPVESAKWDKRVPKVMNIGKDVFIAKAVNWAFEKEPEYFVLLTSA